MKKKVKGLSPVIATVLLITIVIVMALIVFFWIKGMTGEKITKFGEQNIQLACDQVYFDASYDAGTLYITNPGNVPIFDMNVKVVGEGSHSTLDLKDETSQWPETGLNQGGAFSEDIDLDGEEAVLIPILLGNSEDGRKTYVCDENQYGVSITI